MESTVLRQCGSGDAQILRIISSAAPDGGGNPQSLTEDDVEELFNN